MTHRCGYNGTATVQTHQTNPGIEPVLDWLQADDRIHVVSELVDNASASDWISQRYDIGAWCDEAQAYHATLRDSA